MLPGNVTGPAVKSSGTGSVGINAHLLSDQAGYRRAGIHHYIAQVLRYLPQKGDNPHYTIFTRHGKSLIDKSGRSDYTTMVSRWPTEQRLVRIAWEQIAWPRLAARYNLDLLHSMAFVTPLLAPCPTVVTIYDLSFIHYPERFPVLQRLYLQTQSGRSCRQAQRVITISESSRQDVHRIFGVPRPQIDVVYPGVDRRYRPLPAVEVDAFRHRRKLPSRFILHVGTLQPRKNIPVLLDALARLSRPALPLVLVGGKGWLFDDIFARIEALGLQERVYFAGYVPDEELPLWYNAATLFVFPSLYEGFGMPVVEAMACGTPVIAADASSLPEAAGGAALLFAPQDTADLVERIESVLDDPGLWTKMREGGLAQAQNFSWERAGEETAVVYHRALRKK